MKWGLLTLNLIWLTFLYLIFASSQNHYLYLEQISKEMTYSLPPNTTIVCDSWECNYVPICITEECLSELQKQ